MDIYMIWATDGDGYYWLVDSWDDDTISENRQGWDEARKEAVEQHGADNVRVLVTTVDMDAVRKAFEVPRVGSLSTRAVEDIRMQDRVRLVQELQELRDTIPSDNPNGTAQRRGIQRAIKIANRLED